MKNISIFPLLVSLLSRIKGDSGNVTVENETATGILPGNNLESARSMITSITGENDNELNTPFNEKNNKTTESTVEIISISSLQMIQRISRDTENKTSNSMECILCYGSGITSEDKNCYIGIPDKTQKCADTEQCFTELHPQYIKRGCMLPSAINRTFVCKCPLCNDKPTVDLVYYEYRSISDWEYDNKRLHEPVIAIDLLCKVCETIGLNAAIDRKCKIGKYVDYMQCTRNQLCFTNIDHQTDSVSRGCIDKPVYNAMYFFCNDSMCNNEAYSNPKYTDFMFRTMELENAESSACQTKRSFSIVMKFFSSAVVMIILSSE